MTVSQLITFLLIGIGLCFDTFAVSVSFGVMKKEIHFRQALRVAFPMAIVQALFPIIGWFVGMSLKDLIASVDHWIAFGLLALIGIKMIWDGARDEEEPKTFDFMNPVILLGLSVATSIDALVVGLSFGFLDTHILFPAGVIGFVTFIAAMLGMLFGKKIPGKTSHRSLIAGGVILILIGIKIMAEHLWA